MEEHQPLKEVAVSLQDVHKSYGRRSKKREVLRGITLSVPKGSIYGLLGPSGCGKTTALRCAIGRLRADSGTIVTLGKPPNSIGHGVPGRKIGYMPQELALYKEMTIGETLSYFGRLHNMGRKHIKQRIEFLLEFLHLPSQSQLIETLSGGEQRRTSFAISLLHEPELLILDEPTVGVDPLLRQRIWSHLVELARESHITIVITTHYIDEARQAHTVGLMRNGRLLAEASPQQLLQMHHKENLEDVFLIMCQREEDGEIKSVASSPHRLSNGSTSHVSYSVMKQNDIGDRLAHSTNSLAQDLVIDVPPEKQSHHSCTIVVPEKESTSCGARCCYLIPSGWNILAMCIKQIIVLRRQIGMLLFMFAMPALQMTLVCLCIGRTPFGLELAIVNAETPNLDACPSPACSNRTTQFGCCFLSHIDSHTITQVNFGADLQAGTHCVDQGDCWGTIDIRPNFTQNIIQRMIMMPLTPDMLQQSEIHVRLDMSNQQVAYTLQRKLLLAMQHFMDHLIYLSNRDPEKARIPMQFEEPIYGELQPSFTNFMVPGMILSLAYLLAIALTALIVVHERKEGLLDRTFTSGATAVEVILAHTLTECVILMVQVALLLIVTLVIFGVTSEGPLYLVVFLTFCTGLTGMAFGILISAVVDGERQAIQAALGSIFPNLLLCGIIWPLEGMPYAVRIVSRILPMTYATEAIRSILLRGWNMEYLEVWRGFAVTIGYFFLIMILCSIVFKRNTS